MDVKYAQRIVNLPPYLFEEISKAKSEALKKGKDVIDLGVGDPDTPTPDFIIKELHKASMDPANHKYPLNKGIPALRGAMADWYRSRFGVDLDPETEVLPILGSKEGIAHVPLAFVNKGDIVLVPEPGYPPYKSGTILSDGEFWTMPLDKDKGFLPELDRIPADVVKKAKLMHINYPNNPTGAVCDASFYRDVVKFAKENGIIVCSDAAYTEISYDGYNPISFLEIDGAKDVGIEFHSLSKTFNMTGWRIGMAVGNPDIIAGLAKVKSNIDSGVFTPVQLAAVRALSRWEEVKKEMNGMYQSRRDVFVTKLRKMGWDVKPPVATFYIWAPVFGGYDSFSLAKELLERSAIVVTPGGGFGPSGEGFVRMALTVDEHRLSEAAERVKKAFFAK